MVLKIQYHTVLYNINISKENKIKYLKMIISGNLNCNAQTDKIIQWKVSIVVSVELGADQIPHYVFTKILLDIT